MEKTISYLLSQLGAACARMILAVLLLIAGRILIRAALRRLEQNSFFQKADKAVRTFSLSFAKTALFLLLAAAIVNVLGVPLSAVAALIASAGVAVGLGFQGALANLAGGVMLILFKPFRLGDYIGAADIVGTAKEINLFYTVLITADNKRVTIPNGTLMNTPVTDYTANDVRRVELTFTCARTENPSRVQEVIRRAMEKDARVLREPELPFAGISGSGIEAYEFTARAWCETGRYLEVFYSLAQQIAEALDQAGVSAPAVRVVCGAAPASASENRFTPSGRGR